MSLDSCVIRNANADLHVHPYLFGKRTKLADVVRAMKKRDLILAGVGELNNNISREMKRQAIEMGIGKKDIDEFGIRFKDSKTDNYRYLFPFTELETKEGFHVVIMGYQIDCAQRMEIKKIADESLENEADIYLDHIGTREDSFGDISEDKREELMDFLRYYKKDLKNFRLDFNGTNNKNIRRLIKPVFNAFGDHIKKYDTNEVVGNIAEDLLKEGISIPLVAYTDLHAWMPFLLNYMGRTGIIFDKDKIKGCSPEEASRILSGEISDNRHQNVKESVPEFYSILSYGAPYVINKASGGLLFPRPRS